MRLGARELGFWSFLMASAHGAGLMLFPVLINLPICGRIGSYQAAASSGLTIAAVSIAIVALHTAAMLAVMGTVALLVYDRIGLGILRSAWVNFDKLWAAALMGSGLLVLAL